MSEAGRGRVRKRGSDAVLPWAVSVEPRRVVHSPTVERGEIRFWPNRSGRDRSRQGLGHRRGRSLCAGHGPNARRALCDVRIVTQETKDSPDKTSMSTAAGVVGALSSFRCGASSALRRSPNTWPSEPRNPRVRPRRGDQAQGHAQEHSHRGAARLCRRGRGEATVDALSRAIRRSTRNWYGEARTNRIAPTSPCPSSPSTSRRRSTPRRSSRTSAHGKGWRERA